MGRLDATSYDYETVEGYFRQDQPDIDVKKFDYVRTAVCPSE